MLYSLKNQIKQILPSQILLSFSVDPIERNHSENVAMDLSRDQWLACNFVDIPFSIVNCI